MAHAFVLACIDPRFTKMLADYLIHNKELMNDYDLFALAGAELGANDKKNWKKVLKEHIDIAIQLHNIKKVLVFSHMDCGAYKEFKGIRKDDDPHIHIVELNKLRKFMKRCYPTLEYCGYIMGTNGHIHKVETSAFNK
jgi:carbonic anhydrase